MFAKESDLCTAFIAAVQSPWVAYAETAGWDILLFNKEDDRQIGIQAKLKLNATVIRQAVETEGWYVSVGPDYRAILVPWDQVNELSALAPLCNLTVIRMRDQAAKYHCRSFTPSLPVGTNRWNEPDREWYECLPTTRHQMPEFIPDVIAGSSAPIKLTTWKIAALKLSVLLDRTGFLTRADFKRHKLDIRGWIGTQKWLLPAEVGFVRGPRLPDLRIQHPRVWAEIEADPEKWQRAHGVLL
jgi:hypothetical protein